MATIVSSALFAACTPSVPPTSSPTPSPSASSAGPTETEFQRQERVAYEGAEAAYRAFRAEYSREIASTYKPAITDKMRAHAGGAYLRDYAGFLRLRRKQEVKAVGNLRIGGLRPVLYAPPNRVVLMVCEDGSKVRVVNRAGRRVGKGSVTTYELTAHLVGGKWKAWSGDHQKTVKSCEE